MEFAIASGLLALVRQAMTMYQQYRSGHEFTVEEQSKLDAQMEDIRSGQAFTGEAWRKSS